MTLFPTMTSAFSLSPTVPTNGRHRHYNPLTSSLFLSSDTVPFRTRQGSSFATSPSTVAWVASFSASTTTSTRLFQSSNIRDAIDEEKDETTTIGIGIDLGTTNSAVAYLKDGVTPTIIPIPHNGRTMPSLVALLEQEEENNDNKSPLAIVGQQALEYGAQPPYANVKRVLGTGGKLSNDVKQVVPYLVPNPEGKTYKKMNLDNQLHDAQHFPTMLLRKTISTTTKNAPPTTSSSSTNATTTTLIRPEDISTHIVSHLKRVAEDYTGCRVTRAVIGVPAYFHDAQRAATLAAAHAAGLEKVQLLREPEAAALAYGIGKAQIGKDDDDELVLAFDLGGGTFDVSMLVVGGGVSEILCTAGNAQLGGANFDARIAQYIRSQIGTSVVQKFTSPDAQNAIVQAAEQIRIHLSNNRRATLRLPTTEEGWRSLKSAKEVIVDSNDSAVNNESGDEKISDASVVTCQFTRREMERLCKDEFQALLRPVREVAIMAGALLPGDTSPTLVEAALEMEEEWNKGRGDSLAFGDFYEQENDNNAENSNDVEVDEIDSNTLLQLEKAALKETKRAQQKGRKRARDLSKEQRKFRQEKRKVAAESSSSSTGKASSSSTSAPIAIDGVKVQDGITGRPISRVVLVGGATRMPAVGRLIGALTGVTPQKTVNPDEAVALGCAANVGILDGVDGMGKVLSPMQAALLRAMAEQQGMFDEDFEDDAEFGDVEYF